MWGSRCCPQAALRLHVKHGSAAPQPQSYFLTTKNFLKWLFMELFSFYRQVFGLTRNDPKLFGIILFSTRNLPKFCKI